MYICIISTVGKAKWIGYNMKPNVGLSYKFLFKNSISICIYANNVEKK